MLQKDCVLKLKNDIKILEEKLDDKNRAMIQIKPRPDRPKTLPRTKLKTETANDWNEVFIDSRFKTNISVKFLKPDRLVFNSNFHKVENHK